MEKITKITAFFSATPKGKRKLFQLSHSLDILSGEKTISPDEFNEYERKLLNFIEEQNYKVKPKTAKICANFGQRDNEMIMVQLLAKQTRLVMF